MRALAIQLGLGLGLGLGTAHADGMPGMDMGNTTAVAPETSSIHAGVALVAASFTTMDYVGSYQGALPSLMWMRGRFAAMASVGVYHLLENGRDVRGVGDAMVSGSATLVATERATLGTQLGIMVPTGAQADGLGMGHSMGSLVLTSAVQLTERLSIHGTVGYSRALVFDGAMHHHGAMPLVEPMNPAELVWSAGGDVALARGIASGARIWGGVPAGETGVTRVAGALRVGWRHGKVSTAAELQAGIVGDPFDVRALLETGVSF